MTYYAIPGIIRDKKAFNDVIINEVMEEFNVSKRDIFGQVRERNIVDARKTVQYLMIRLNNLSKSEVARIFKKHHTTIMNAYRSISGFVETDPKFRERIDRIIKRIEN